VNRRSFITLLGGAAVGWPLAVRAQQAERMRRIGFLRAAPPSERELEGLLRGLADQGWVQGRNFVLLPQWGDGQVARLPELAVALVNSGVDIILAEGVVTARAALCRKTANQARPSGSVSAFRPPIMAASRRL
jgi:putative tryptophan/tyrosine transport system substrate-binding protein